MKPYLVTLTPVRINDWIVKGSVFEEQILIFFYNVDTMSCIVRLFTDENLAHDFLRKVTENDLSAKSYHG